MSTYGLTDAGFVKMTFADIQGETEDSYKQAFGDGIDLDGDSVMGQIRGILDEREATLWDLLEAVFYSPFPDYSTGVPLQLAATITGTTALKQTFSQVTGTATGTPGTLLAAGRVASVQPSGDKFQTAQDYTIGEGGTVDMVFTAQNPGPITAPSGTLTKIETPVSGWTSITNAADESTLGRYAENDTDLRTRRAERLVTSEGGTPPSLERRLRDVAGVVFAGVQYNRSDTTDGSGNPPHSIHITVIGGTDADLAAVIWDAAPAGIEQVGSVAQNVTDSFGNTQTVKYDRGTEVPIYLIINRTTSAGYPADGDTQILDALLAYGATFTNDQEVNNFLMLRAVPILTGLETITIYMGTAPSPGSTANIAIAGNQVATFASAHISFTP